MALIDQINSDLALLMRDPAKKQELGVLRLMKSALMNAEIEKRAKVGREAKLDDAESTFSIQKAIKSLEESRDLYKQGGREDLVTQTEAELVIMRRYVPAPLTHDEIGKIVQEAVQEATANNSANFGAVMKLVTPQTKGRADGALVASLVKKALGQ